MNNNNDNDVRTIYLHTFTSFVNNKILDEKKSGKLKDEYTEDDFTKNWVVNYVKEQELGKYALQIREIMSASNEKANKETTDKVNNVLRRFEEDFDWMTVMVINSLLRDNEGGDPYKLYESFIQTSNIIDAANMLVTKFIMTGEW